MYQPMYNNRPSKRFRRVKPVARVGAVDISVRYDLRNYKTNNGQARGCSSECFDILEGEVLFKPRGANIYRNNSLHVLSCSNGSNDIGAPHVCGVAVTGFNLKHDVYEQGFVMQASGLCTIFNNSGENIPAGEPIYVKFNPRDSDGKPIRNSSNPQGIPLEKQLLQLVTKGNDNVQPEKSSFLGTCVKGGKNKSNIDIVLHNINGHGGEGRFVASESRFESAQVSSRFDGGVKALNALDAAPKKKKAKGKK